ncbi:hypothetical protein DL546_005463 [Coniochaeta pulveracea]|uniref:PH domain-containing protein n=1 Tax=Coniochaeta pulveracea TaxID=177199 RepID=A0A420Y6T2_9PEZI|nr:hypothetical protein DL546_005463 [Coniochaeta pulveracea]
MVEVQSRCPIPFSEGGPAQRSSTFSIPSPSIDIPRKSFTERLRSRLTLDSHSPVNQNGSFEFDRVIKSGYVQKRTQRTKSWKSVYLVLRPNTLSIYKSDKEDRLRHKIFLSDLTAVTLLKDPKQKRHNVFGLFSPARNFHFQASTLKDAKEWVEYIRKDARIEEEEEEMFLASPVIQGPSYMGFMAQEGGSNNALTGHERLASSSPEAHETVVPVLVTTPPTMRRPSVRRASQIDSSGMSGAELASHSDFSDAEVGRIGPSMENLSIHPTFTPIDRPDLGTNSASQASGLNAFEQDPDRVIWQGRLWFLRNKTGVRQWKNMWAVLRPRNFILYKDESEYSARYIFQMSSIVNVVDIDPVSRSKTHCLQLITDEKGYKFCAHDEETLVRCLGAFKSLLAKRRELEAKVAAQAAADTGGPP